MDFICLIQVGRLHCLLPWWEDATVDFMISGGYNVCKQIEQVTSSKLINNFTMTIFFAKEAFHGLHK